MSAPEHLITDADWQTVLEVGAVALHQSDHDAGCPRHEHADRLEGCRTIAEEVLDAAMPVIWRIAAADGEMHELVFTDREARPAKWETRCGRTDVPLERAGSAQPGMHYPVTCKACLRIAGLEAALKRFEHLEEAAIAAAAGRRSAELMRDLGRGQAADRERIAELEAITDEMLAVLGKFWSVPGPDLARWHQVRHAGSGAADAADELSRLNEELRGGEPS